MKIALGAVNQPFEGLSGATAAGRSAQDHPPTADQYLRPVRDLHQREGSPSHRHPGEALHQDEALSQPEMRVLPPLLLKRVRSPPPRGEAIMGLQAGKMEILLLVSDLTQVLPLSREVASLHQFHPVPSKKGRPVFKAKSQQNALSRQ